MPTAYSMPSFMPSKMSIAKYFTRHMLKRENNTKTQQMTHTHTHTGSTRGGT